MSDLPPPAQPDPVGRRDGVRRQPRQQGALGGGRKLTDWSASSVVAGFVAALTGYTSSLVLMIQAGHAAGLTEAQISSWIWALSMAMGLSSIFLSWRWRAPIVVAWSTPGAALLITSLPGVAYADAIGAFILSAVLVTAVGISGLFDRLMRHVPASLAAALLAGILFRIGSQAFVVAGTQMALVGSMFLVFMLAKRFLPRFATLAALLAGVVIAIAEHALDFSGFHIAVARPVLTLPHFSLAASISIGVPLFIVAMTSQNMPGLSVLRADGYSTPSSPLISATGLASLVFAFFGGHGVTLAAITAAICTNPQAHPDPTKRYTAAIACGVFYLIAGAFGATIAALFAAFPAALVLTIAALALLGSIASGLSGAMRDPGQRDAALVTFLVTASGMSLLNIGSAFWGLVAGLLTQFILHARLRRKYP